MLTAEGLASLTVHKRLFFMHLAASVGNAGDGPFEIVKITVTVALLLLHCCFTSTVNI